MIEVVSKECPNAECDNSGPVLDRTREDAERYSYFCGNCHHGWYGDKTVRGKLGWVSEEELGDPDDLEGRELDVAVAEYLLGWSKRLDGQAKLEEPIRIWEDSSSGEHLCGANGWEDCDDLPRYSSDLRAAWRMLEQLPLEAVEPPAGRSDRRAVVSVRVWIGKPPSGDAFWGRGFSAPTAICRALLHAVRGA